MNISVETKDRVVVTLLPLLFRNDSISDFASRLCCGILDFAGKHGSIKQQNFDADEIPEDRVKFATASNGKPYAYDPKTGQTSGLGPADKKTARSAKTSTHKNQASPLSSKRSAPVKNHFSGDFPEVQTFTNLKTLRDKYPDVYGAAKKGNFKAAQSLAYLCVCGDKKKQERLNAFVEKYKDAVVVPVMPENLTGGNMIPFAFASLLQKNGMNVDTGIHQIGKVGRTGKEKRDRLFDKPEFAGDVKEGQTYVLLDDHFTTGGTLNSLRMYIESKGGKVVCCTTISASQNKKQMAITKNTVSEVKKKFGFGIDTMLRESGAAYDVESLTEKEGQYLLKANSDELYDKMMRRIMGRE